MVTTLQSHQCSLMATRQASARQPSCDATRIAASDTHGLSRRTRTAIHAREATAEDSWGVTSTSSSVSKVAGLTMRPFAGRRRSLRSLRAMPRESRPATLEGSREGRERRSAPAKALQRIPEVRLHVLQCLHGCKPNDSALRGTAQDPFAAFARCHKDRGQRHLRALAKNAKGDPCPRSHGRGSLRSPPPRPPWPPWLQGRLRGSRCGPSRDRAGPLRTLRAIPYASRASDTRSDRTRGDPTRIAASATSGRRSGARGSPRGTARRR
jgi:hypothetical protein